MAADAIEPVVQQSDAVQELCGADGMLDLQKIRQRNLTDKQLQLVAKAEQKQRRIANLSREMERMEERSVTQKRRKADRELDACDFESHADQDKLSNATLEKMQQIKEKREKAEEDLQTATDNLLLSLGLKIERELHEPSKKSAELYDTTLLHAGEDDDFFDRTARKPLTKPGREEGEGANGQNKADAEGIPKLAAVSILVGSQSAGWEPYCSPHNVTCVAVWTLECLRLKGFGKSNPGGISP